MTNLSTILILLLVLCVTASTTRSITIVKDGKSDWVILISSEASKPMKHGAIEIQQHIERMSGAKLPIVETIAPSAKGAIVITEARNLHPEEFIIVSSIHKEEKKIPKIEIIGDSLRGALYGCYAFLEDVLGCRWYTPEITYIPERKTIAVPVLNIREKPAFEYREPFFFEAFDRDWAVRNRTNGNTQRLDESVGGRIVYGRFVHTFQEIVPPEIYFDEHPEYFSQIDGKRMKGYFQLCLTNPDVLRITVSKVKQWILENPEARIFSVSQNDTHYNCQCETCKAIEREEGSPSGVLLRFVNAVAKEIEKEYPHILIDTLAYQWSEPPPMKTKPRSNVRVRLAPIGNCFAHPIDRCEKNQRMYANLKEWAKITNNLYLWHYSTNFANYLQPLPSLDEISTSLPLYKKHGVVGVFYQGSYESPGGALAELKAYLCAKLMWNPLRPVKPIINDYLKGVYHDAAPYMKQWLDLIHEEVRKGKHAFIYDSPNADYLTKETLSSSDKIIAQAEQAVKHDLIAKKQVEKVQLWMDYVKLMRLPSGDSRRTPLIKKLIEKFKRFGITRAKEGEPLEVFFNRVGN